MGQVKDERLVFGTLKEGVEKHGSKEIHLHLDRYKWASSWIGLPSSILDCACGCGYGSAMLAKRHKPARVVGVDISEEAVAYAKRIYRRRTVEYRVGDLLSLNLHQRFEAVVSLETIEHTPDPVLAIRNLLKHLKPERYIVISMPIIRTLHRNPFHKYEVSSEEEAAELLQKAGLEIKQTWIQEEVYGLFSCVERKAK